MQEFLKQLNPSQRSAVEATEGAVMVIAGAGSGKTRVLTYRVAYLIKEKGIDPFNILSLTFTNKAAKEMKERIARIVGDSEAKNLWMGTFHSIFARMLRVEGHQLGYPPNFTIYDAEDSKKAINNTIKGLSLDKEIYKPNNVARRISAFKNALITPKEYLNSPDLKEQDAAARMPLMGDIYRGYFEKCFRAGAMDFDDLLLNTYFLLRKFPEVLAKYQDRFRYILVDEYQDTNRAQYLIVKALGNRYGNVCVVGDDAQSIYSFRGANIQNILNFQQDYDEVQQHKLEQNYRSTKTLVGAANSLIKKNRDQLHKEVWTANDEGNKINLHKLVSDIDEGNFVAKTIWETRMSDKRAYSDYAILYRTNAQSRAMEDALRRRNIPYRIYGGLSFYQRKEVKDLLAYFRLVINPNDEEALRRVINYPKRAIGDTSVERITVMADREGVSMWEICTNLAVYGQASGINRPTQVKIADFINKIQSYQVMMDKYDAFDLASHITKTSGLIRELKTDDTPEGISRTENIEQLLNSVKEFTETRKETEGDDATLPSFMEDVALLTDRDIEKDGDDEKVSLMTIHLAKGLEFPVVFVVGLEENLFPSMLSVNSRADLEEERRLFYVALTRAEQAGYVTHAQMRYRWGKSIDCEPSRFLEEIDDEFLNVAVPEFSPFMGDDGMGLGDLSSKSNKSFRKPTRKSASTGTKSAPPRMPRRNLSRMESVSNDSGNYEALSDVTAGEKVQHQRFGLGVILNVEGAGPNKKAIIQFENVGEKKLLLKFAKLEKL